MSPIGLFGLGLIGEAIATRLIAHGHDLRGYDPSPERCAHFAGIGGTVSQAEQVWQAEIVFSCVFDTDQLATLVDAAPAGQCVLVSVSTCDPDRMQGLGESAAAKGITLIEAPISGTSRELAEGDVLMLTAGDPEVITRLEAIFDALCRQHIHVGAIGNGNRAKLAINLVLGLNRAALAEGLVFAEALGLDPDDFLSMAQASAAHSAVMASKGKLMTERDFAPRGRVRQSAKDFKLIRDAAAAAGQGLPFTETYLKMMQNAIQSGEGELDNSAILLPISRTPPP